MRLAPVLGVEKALFPLSRFKVEKGLKMTFLVPLQRALHTQPANCRRELSAHQNIRTFFVLPSRKAVEIRPSPDVFHAPSFTTKLFFPK